MFPWHSVAVLFVVFLSQATGSPPPKFSHPGTIVDAVTGDGIEARAIAFGSQNQVGDADCPVYDDTLDTRRSQSGTGSFTFQIDSVRSSYLATYCEGGYAYRVVRDNDNLRDGSRVQPDPVELYPTRAKLTAQQLGPREAAFRAIGRELDRAQANLYYFSQADEGGFYKALGSFPEEDQQAIIILLNRRPTFAELIAVE